MNTPADDADADKTNLHQGALPLGDASKNADDTHAFQAPLEDTVTPKSADSPSADSSVDPDVTSVGQVFNPEQTLDFSASQSTKYKIDIPGYELIHELGRGAMGVVYKARQIRADRIVALKLMINLEHAKPHDIERFTIEAQSSARLHHPNIIQVYDVSQTGQSPYFTQEFAPGGTLAKKIAKQMLSHRDVAETMLCLANAVAYAHSRQIVHRDLKPLNILLDEHGVPKIADFGLARRMEDQSHLTQDGTILGTPSYMAPEQASGNSNAIGPLSDVYALGAILFELLTGRPPFKGATVWEVIQQVRSADPSPPSQLQSGIPADLETICLKCLQKAPEKRYESAKHLSDDIQRHINHEPILARPVGQWERLVRLCRRNPREARLVSLVAGLLACFAIVAAFTAFRISQDRNQIVKQRDEISGQKDRIEKQRDEITKEKTISDDRLSLYRNTVSKFVNRVPRLLQDAPFGAGTRTELMGLIGGILSGDKESGVVGSAQKWGQLAVAIREGEIAWASASGNQKIYKSQTDLYSSLALAAERFADADRIATEVYQSDEPDRAKAASNLASAKVRIAQLEFESDPKAWQQQSLTFFKEALKLRREAIAANPIEGSDPVALRQAELALDLQRYAFFLMAADSKNPKHIVRATEVLAEAEGLLKDAIANVANRPDLEETFRDTLAQTLNTLANAQILAGDDVKVRGAYEAAIDQYQALLAKAPYRYTFLKNASNCANAYGDYLLTLGADPKSIEQQYRFALDSIKAMLMTPESKEHERTGIGLGYYRIGLVMLRQNRSEEANQAFKKCEVMRAKAYFDQKEELGTKATSRVLAAYLIEWLIVQARLGMAEQSVAGVRELLAVATTTTEADGEIAPTSLYKHAAACMGMLSSTQVPSNPTVAAKYLDNAMKLLDKAISAGYSDIEYLRTDPDFDWLQKEGLIGQVEEWMRALR